ncbi:hypothetical protein JOM56_012564 [Amanita muscaria]
MFAVWCSSAASDERRDRVRSLYQCVTATARRSHAFLLLPSTVTVLSLVSSSAIEPFVFPTHRSLFAPPAPPQSVQVVTDSSTMHAASRAFFPTRPTRLSHPLESGTLPGRKAFGFHPNWHHQASATHLRSTPNTKRRHLGDEKSHGVTSLI